MSYPTIIAAYQDYEPYELNGMQAHLLALMQQNDPLPAFLLMIDILKNEMLGSFHQINGHLYYDLSIRIRTQTRYEYVEHNGSTSKLDAQKIDAIRYRIEPIVDTVNEVFAHLTPQQSYLFYNAYIHHIKQDGYAIRSLKQALRKTLDRLNSH